jgi:hypothetical protein
MAVKINEFNSVFIGKINEFPRVFRVEIADKSEVFRIVITKVLQFLERLFQIALCVFGLSVCDPCPAGICNFHFVCSPSVY